MRRKCEIINEISLLINTEQKLELQHFIIDKLGFDVQIQDESYWILQTQNQTKIHCKFSNNQNWSSQLFLLTGNEAHFSEIANFDQIALTNVNFENEIKKNPFDSCQKQWIKMKLKNSKINIK